jgi:hypothetical protein
MDRKFCNIVIVSAAVLTGIPVLMLTGCYLWAKGIWPFSPLKPRLEVIELQNGGKIEMEYTPFRDLTESGWHAKGRYLNPYSKGRENIGQWFDCGYYPNLQAYALNDLVVFLAPDRERLYVRTKIGYWTEFQLNYWKLHDLLLWSSPDNDAGHPLGAEALKRMTRIRNFLNEAGIRDGGLGFNDKFDVVNGELIFAFSTRPESLRTLVLRLNDEGTHLKLERMETRATEGFRLEIPDPHRHRTLVHQAPWAKEVNDEQFREVTLSQDSLEQEIITKDGRLRAFITRSAQGYRLCYEIIATGKIFEIRQVRYTELPFDSITWVANRYLVFDQWRRHSIYYAHQVVDTEARRIVLLASVSDLAIP